MFQSSSNEVPIFGKTIVVVAGGPSVNLKDLRTLSRARDADKCRVIAVNDAVFVCWFADRLHASDKRWWVANNGVQTFQGIKTSLEETGFEDVFAFDHTGREGYDPSPDGMRSGSNSGYQAVHLAAKLGAKKIILLGVDYTSDGARDHWFGLHDPSMDRHSDVQDWRRLFRLLSNKLSSMGIEIVNVGAESTLTWLRRSTMQQELP